MILFRIEQGANSWQRPVNTVGKRNMDEGKPVEAVALLVSEVVS